MTGDTDARSLRRRGGAVVLRVLAFAALWWIVSEGRLYSVGFAAFGVCAAAAASVALRALPPVRWRAGRLVLLALYFARVSVFGGWDIARRALTPAMPLERGYVRVELTLPAGFSTVLFTWLVSLTPGTAAVRLEGGVLLVHALDTRVDVQGSLRRLQARVNACVAR